jgi:hypothetical protein
MKKLIILFVALCVLAGCRFKTNYIPTNKDERADVPVIQTEGERPDTTITFNKISHIEYDGHIWVVFEKATSHNYIYDVEHDPECWCLPGDDIDYE